MVLILALVIVGPSACKRDFAGACCDASIGVATAVGAGVGAGVATSGMADGHVDVGVFVDVGAFCEWCRYRSACLGAAGMEGRDNVPDAWSDLISALLLVSAALMKSTRLAL